MDSAAKTIQVDYEVKILSPFHVGTGYGLASLVDSRTVRDREGLAYIPGSTVKGLVREGFRKVASLFGTDIVLCGAECGECLECVVFGTARKPGILAFGDARLPEKKALEIDELFENHPLPRHTADSEARTCVSITRWSRTALSRHLFTFELAGNHLCYEGSILGCPMEPPSPTAVNPEPQNGSGAGEPSAVNAGDSEGSGEGGGVSSGRHADMPLYLPYLAAAMSSVESIGRGKSRGWGRCEMRIARIFIGGCGKEISHEQLLSCLGEATR